MHLNVPLDPVALAPQSRLPPERAPLPVSAPSAVRPQRHRRDQATHASPRRAPALDWTRSPGPCATALWIKRSSHGTAPRARQAEIVHGSLLLLLHRVQEEKVRVSTSALSTINSRPYQGAKINVNTLHVMHVQVDFKQSIGISLRCSRLSLHRLTGLELDDTIWSKA